MQDEPRQALAGIRVVDFSNVRTGAQISQTLADFGADVIHIEIPGGSPLRQEAAWPMWARGKRSIALDLKQDEDLQVALSLAHSADVVIETWRPGVADRLGLGYEALAATNPQLVYCSVTGFGRNSPYAQVQGYEGIVSARLGVPYMLESLTDRPGPSFATAAYATYPATQLGLHGILAALMAREDTGLGQWVETTLVQGQTVYDTYNWFARLLALKFNEGFKQATRNEEGVPVGGLSYRLLVALTKDGRWLQFSQTPPRLFRAMMQLFGLEWMFDDPKWKTVPEFETVAQRREYWEMLLNIVRSKTADEWMAEFDKHPDVWGEIFHQGAELLDHPQMHWNRMVAEREDNVLGKVRSPGPIAHLSETPAIIDLPAPAPGAHDTVIRAEAASAVPVPGSRRAGTGAEPSAAPLAGITVVELGTYYAAPYAATLMAELGARVIKLEELGGDPHRHMLPFPEVAGIKVLQGKQSLAVDLASEDGRAIAHRIAAQADVVLQSFRGGAAKKLGLDAETLRAINPDLIYHNAPGYGTDGPYARRPAFAPTICAAAGFADRNAGRSIPTRADLTLEEIKPASLKLFTANASAGNADGLSAATAATGMLMALYARKRGLGAQEVFTSMLSSSAHALSEVLVTYPGAPDAAIADPDSLGLSALYRLYQAGDGKWVFLAAPSERDWARLVSALTHGQDLADDPRFADASSRADHDHALAEVLGQMLASRPAAEWEADLIAKGVACVQVWEGPVEANFIDEGSFGRQSGFVTESRHAFLDEIPRLAPLVKFSRASTVAGKAGLLGEETEIVLRDFGFSDEEIAGYKERGAIMQA